MIANFVVCVCVGFFFFCQVGAHIIINKGKDREIAPREVGYNSSPFPAVKGGLLNLGFGTLCPLVPCWGEEANTETGRCCICWDI